MDRYCVQICKEFDEFPKHDSIVIIPFIPVIWDIIKLDGIIYRIVDRMVAINRSSRTDIVNQIAIKVKEIPREWLNLVDPNVNIYKLAICTIWAS